MIERSSNVQMAEYLILSTTYKTASSIAKVAGSAFGEALKPEVAGEPEEKHSAWRAYASTGAEWLAST